MVAHLKDALIAASVRLETTILNDNDDVAIKKARTRFQNAHRTYWRAVRAARRELQSGKAATSMAAAEAHGIDPLDLFEVDISEREAE